MSETCRIRPVGPPTEPVVPERRSQRSRDFRATLAEMWERDRQAHAAAVIREHELIDQVMRLTEENRRLRQLATDRLVHPGPRLAAAQPPSTPNGGRANSSGNGAATPGAAAGAQTVSFPILQDLPTVRPPSIPREGGSDLGTTDVP